MHADMLILFIVSSTLLAITPGPTMLLALANGVAGGLRVAVFGIIGASLASSTLIAAVALGLGSLLAASEALFNAVRIAGVIYLGWLGFKLWRAQPQALGEMAAGTGRAKLSPGTAFLRSLTVALSNPKTLLFFGAFLPQFIDPAQTQWPQYLSLGAMFVGIDTVVMVAYAMAGSRAMRVMSRRGLLVVNRSCAAGMWLLAATLAGFRR
jgi:threonine/homoserine/homoserine lactone efflux protein